MNVRHLADLLTWTRERELPAQDAYALWADTYPARAHNPLMEAEEAIVARLIATAAPVRALDVGTGTGRNLALLSAAGARTIVGVDRSAAMLSRNSSASPSVCADARRLPFPDGTFDLVCSSLMAGDLDDLRPWTTEAARTLRPGGALVYSDFHPIWAEARWRRTFRTSDGRRFAAAYYPHRIDEHVAALEAAGLTVRAIREPRAAGRRQPVVVVFHAQKPPVATRLSRAC